MASRICFVAASTLMLSVGVLVSLGEAHSDHSHEHAETVLHGSGDDPVTLASLDRRIHEINQKITVHENTVRLRDILGGIGFIVGLAGTAFYFSGRRRNALTRGGDQHNAL